MGFAQKPRFVVPKAKAKPKKSKSRKLEQKLLVKNECCIFMYKNIPKNRENKNHERFFTKKIKITKLCLNMPYF